jgi:hypothetical protein
VDRSEERSLFRHVSRVSRRLCGNLIRWVLGDMVSLPAAGAGPSAPSLPLYGPSRSC